MPSEDFKNNPFLKLDKTLFPASKMPKTNMEPGISKHLSEEDRALFLAALQTVPINKNKKKKTIFTLADLCEWPAKIIGKKKIAPEPEKEIIVQEQNEDVEAFLQAMAKTTPLDGKGRKIVPHIENRTQTASKKTDFAQLVEESLDFALYHSDEYLEGKVCGFDELVMNRLRQGQMSPEAHLDLHGLNSNQAFEALRDFIRASWYKGMRVVLLVPGRGLNSPNGRSILRQKLQLWLTQEPFKRVVLAFCTAKPHDGGPGSIYALLRKFRKKGHIHWNTLPADADLYE